MLKNGDGSCDINDDTIPSYDLDAARTSYFAHLESERATRLPLSNSIGRPSTRTLSKRTAQDLINDPDVMTFKRRRYQDNGDGENDDDAIYRPSVQLNDDTDEAFCRSLAIHLRSLPEPIRTGTRLKLQQVMARTVVEMNNGNCGNRFEPRKTKQEEPINLD